ncbi:MAG: hypothetical protein WD270_05385 [Acetobacterales bacterium]
MAEDIRPLILDLVEWVAARPRPYGEVMDAWRTSCPRLTVWEDAVDDGLVATERRDDVMLVRVTDAGRAALKYAGRRAAA